MTILAFSVTIFENEITTKSKYLPPGCFWKIERFIFFEVYPFGCTLGYLWRSGKVKIGADDLLNRCG
jgi:hypothetical protein